MLELFDYIEVRAHGRVRKGAALSERERENIARCKAVRARVKAECDAKGRNDPTWPGRRAKLEEALLKERPHLAKQKHCGLAPDSDAPRKRVVLPNGHVLYSTWYRPSKESDPTRLREQQWLDSPEGRAWYADTFASIREARNASAA